jgi:hypothetical protein
MMAGGGFTVLTLLLLKSLKQMWKLLTQFSSIMGGSAKESQLGASLAAEVLHDQKHVAEIFKKGSPDGLLRKHRRNYYLYLK